jgi:hypothetical protein
MNGLDCSTLRGFASMLAFVCIALASSPAGSQSPPTVAVLDSPITGSASVWSPVVFAWAPVPNASAYYLYVGLTPGAKDVADTGEVSGTQLVYSLPTGTYYARLYTEVAATWYHAQDVVFTVTASPAAAALIYPTDGSNQVNPTVGFKWSSVGGADGYKLTIGTVLGASDAYQSAKSTATSLTVKLNSSTKYYVRLETYYGGRTVMSASSFTTTVMPSTLLSPRNGATQVKSNVNFSWTAARNAEAYRLQIGSQAGTADILDSASLTATQMSYSLARGGKYFVRLWSRFYGTWYFADSSFSSGSFAVVTLPANDARYVDQDVTVTWSQVSAAQVYYLYVGNTRRAFDVYNGGETSATSAVMRLAGGRRYYATIWTKASGVWIPSDSSFVTDTGAAQMLYPRDGTTAVPTQVVLAWSAIADATGYQINIGSAAGLSDIFASGIVQTNTVIVPALRSQAKYFIRLTTNKSGAVKFVDSSFTTGSIGTGIAQMVQPPDGATSVDVSRPFSWTPVSDAEKYYLRVGTRPGLGDIFDSAELTSTVVSIPEGRFKSGRYYSSLSTRKNGVWQSIQTTFAVGDRASIVTPADGDSDADPLGPVTWTSFPGAQAYYLYVGTSVGAKDVFESFETLDTLRYVPNLQTGTRYYLRLHTRINDSWVYSDTTFTAGTGLARLIQPVDGSLNADSTAPMVWNTISNAQAYYLTVGSALGTADVYDGGETTITVRLVPRLATGRPYYARLYTKKFDRWKFIDSTFQTSDDTQPPTSTDIKFVAPANGDTGVDPFGTVNWSAAQGATRYMLLIGTSRGAWDVFQSGPITTTSTAPVGLGYDKVYYARLLVERLGQWSFVDISFRTVSPATVANLPQLKLSFYKKVKDLTMGVRLMAADGTNIPVAGTPLEAAVGAGKAATCSQFSDVLTSQMQQAGVGARVRGLTLTGTSYEAHTLVEYYDPFLDKWAVADPTFGLIYFNDAAAVGQSADELSQIINSGQFSSICPRFLTSNAPMLVQAYYLDPITLFANVFPAGLANPVFGPQPNPADPFLMAQDVSTVLGTSGTYLAKFQNSADTLTVRSGGNDITLLPLDGTKWSRAVNLDSGWTIQSSSPGVQLYTFKRIIY